MLSKSEASPLVLELVSVTGNSAQKEGLKTNVDLMVILGSAHPDDAKVPTIARAEEQGFIVCSLVEVANAEFSEADLDPICRKHAKAIASHLKSPDFDIIHSELRTSLKERISLFRRSIVFTVAHDGSEVLDVCATNGFGVEHFWWHQLCDSVKSGQQQLRFTATEPLLANVDSVRDVAATHGWNSMVLLQKCIAASGDLHNRRSRKA